MQSRGPPAPSSRLGEPRAGRGTAPFSLAALDGTGAQQGQCGPGCRVRHSERMRAVAGEGHGRTAV